MKPAVVQVDPERFTVDTLASLLAARGRTERVGTDLPSTWTTDSPMFVQVAHDGTPTLDWPVRAVSTMRVTVWSGTKGAGRDLAALCMGLLLAQPGFSESTGLLLTKDSTTRGRLASFAVLLSQMTVPLP